MAGVGFSRKWQFAIIAHETEIERHILAPRFSWPEIPLERHSCTQARCLAAGLPARLSDVADALELANRKDKAGERLMQQMSKPRRPRKGEDPTKIYWFDDPERLKRFLYDAWRKRHLKYVLLAGDVDVLPVRYI